MERKRPPNRTMINLQKRSILVLFSRLILGAVLIAASIDKILHPEAFAEVIGNYNVLPFGLENIVAITLPILELFIGCCLIFGIMLDGSAIITAGMMCVFIIALSQAMIRGIDINCGCFKVSVDNAGGNIGYRRIIEDILFLGLSLLILNRGERKWELYPKT
ncbi:DoxX family membrane protein [bacterium]|nr:MAG: DoxX family membrane protein [bacterium]